MQTPSLLQAGDRVRIQGKSGSGRAGGGRRGANLEDEGVGVGYGEKGRGVLNAREEALLRVARTARVGGERGQAVRVRPCAIRRALGAGCGLARSVRPADGGSAQHAGADVGVAQGRVDLNEPVGAGPDA